MRKQEYYLLTGLVLTGQYFFSGDLSLFVVGAAFLLVSTVKFSPFSWHREYLTLFSLALLGIVLGGKDYIPQAVLAVFFVVLLGISCFELHISKAVGKVTIGLVLVAGAMCLIFPDLAPLFFALSAVEFYYNYLQAPVVPSSLADKLLLLIFLVFTNVFIVIAFIINVLFVKFFGDKKYLFEVYVVTVALFMALSVSLSHPEILFFVSYMLVALGFSLERSVLTKKLVISAVLIGGVYLFSGVLFSLSTGTRFESVLPFFEVLFVLTFVMGVVGVFFEDKIPLWRKIPA